jgi:hypothetical protein
MDFGRLSRGEWIAMAGGLLLAICLLVPTAYSTDTGNPNAQIDGEAGDFTFFQVHSILRWLLLAAAAAPFILAWIIVREHQLSWPRGQLTSVVAIAALGLILYVGIIQRPGDPSGAITLGVGWYGMVLGGILMLVGSVMRQSETELKRRPPGVLR